jgi:serine/threonine protein kinase
MNIIDDKFLLKNNLRINQYIGEGSYGKVYEAIDINNQ